MTTPNNTTRRYPRSLAEAFPQDHGDAISGPFRRKWRKPSGEVFFMLCLALIGCSVMAMAWVGWLP